jgi:hypothetical protein
LKFLLKFVKIKMTTQIFEFFTGWLRVLDKTATIPINSRGFDASNHTFLMRHGFAVTHL